LCPSKGVTLRLPLFFNNGNYDIVIGKLMEKMQNILGYYLTEDNSLKEVV